MISDSAYEASQLLKAEEVLITDGHFVYASDLHGSSYVKKDAVLQFPHHTLRLGEMVARQFRHLQIDGVIGMAVPAALLSQAVAYHLNELQDRRDIRALYAEKQGQEVILGREFDKFVSQKNLLVVEDIITTGGSVTKLIKVVRNLHGQVSGLGALCNNGGLTAEDFNVKQLSSLIQLPGKIYTFEDCPLCEQKVPINTEVGHGAAFVAAQNVQ